MQSHVDHLDLGRGGASVPPRLKLTQVGLGRFEGWEGPISLGAEARRLFTLVARARAALLGFVFPLISTVWPLGQLAPHVSSDQLNGPRLGKGIEGGI